jgi:predicted small metal-binding protein
MKVLRCRELGFACDREIRAQSMEEVLRQAAEHAHQEHGIEVTPELAELAQRLIREEQEHAST